MASAKKAKNGEKAAIAILTATSTFAAFSQFEPSIFTIKQLAINNPNDIRVGYIPAIGISGAIAFAATQIIDSKIPLAVWALSSLVTVGIYEAALGGLI